MEPIHPLLERDRAKKDYGKVELSILDIKKMIPVPIGCYERVEFDELEDLRYKDLFEKEYAFCLSIKAKVLKKAEKIHQKQKETGIIRRANCNFSELEKAMLNWK